MTNEVSEILAQGIQASWDVHFFVLFFCLFCLMIWSLRRGSISAHSASTRWPLSLFRSPRNLALLPAVYCKLQSHNLYFLKMKKYYQQYILILFKSGFNGIWTILFFLPYLYVVVLVPNKNVFSPEVCAYCLNHRWFECYLHLIVISVSSKKNKKTFV